MFIRIIIIDKTIIVYTANSVEPIYYTILYYTNNYPLTCCLMIGPWEIICKTIHRSIRYQQTKSKTKSTNKSMLVDRTYL